MTTLHRFFLSPHAFEGDRVRFPPEISHQLRRVLRMQPGAEVLVLDGMGAEFVVRLAEVGRAVAGEIVLRRQSRAETARPIVLYQGLLKGSKFETVVQHCTEVGVSRIVPMLTARSIPSEPNPARQRRFEVIAREAAEQSGRGQIPVLAPPMTFESAVADAVATGPTLEPFEGVAGPHLNQIDLGPANTAISLLIGPEGGFSDAEAALASARGAVLCTLGPRILRAETAAIVSAALVAARLDTFSDRNL